MLKYMTNKLLTKDNYKQHSDDHAEYAHNNVLGENNSSFTSALHHVLELLMKL